MISAGVLGAPRPAMAMPGGGAPRAMPIGTPTHGLQATGSRRAGGVRQRRGLVVRAADTYRRDFSAQPRLIQHKAEAKAFYAFLSQVGGAVVGPWPDRRVPPSCPSSSRRRQGRAIDCPCGCHLAPPCASLPPHTCCAVPRRCTTMWSTRGTGPLTCGRMRCSPPSSTLPTSRYRSRMERGRMQCRATPSHSLSHAAWCRCTP